MMPDATLDYSKLYRNSFNITMNAMYSDGTITDISSYLKKLRVETNVLTHVMPMIRLKFELPQETILKIQNDHERVVFSVKIDTLQDNMIGSGLYDTYLKTTILKPMIMDNVLLPHSESSNLSYSKPFECVCVPEYSLTTNKSVFSGVYRNVTITEVLMMLASKSTSKAYIESPDNTIKYDQITLLPGNLYANLSHLENSYGIYKDGLRVFTSFDKLMIMSNSNVESSNSGIVSVHVNFAGSSNSIPGSDIGSYVDNSIYGVNNRNVSIDSKYIAYQDRKVIMNELFGTNIMFEGRNMTGLEQRRSSFNRNDRNGKLDKFQLYENVLNNKLKENSLVNDMSQSTDITLSFADIRIDLDDVFKSFVLKFDNDQYSRYSGSYKAIATIHEFDIADNGSASLTGRVSLRDNV